MTHVVGDPRRFKDDAMFGFGQAYARFVRPVPGASGFARAAGTRGGKVALVVGGGAGHYPSYGGVIGPGFADACVLGDVFTSPSAEQVYRVASYADAGAGVVLAFGNYAGDRLNFATARARLERDGVATCIVYVTDDIASAPRAQRGERRGIAGTFAVYKIGGAAAERGDSLQEVEQLMRRANDATFSFGVAYSGCTLPGSEAPLFAVPDGKMEVGLGIHGEPGTHTTDQMPAPELARLMVDTVLGERPEGSAPTAAVIVNGLGRVKYEELFVLYGHIAGYLDGAGVKVVEPEVGELVTSLDMAGCSLSVTWLDDELQECWSAPADTVAFRRGAFNPPGVAPSSHHAGHRAGPQPPAPQRTADAATTAAPVADASKAAGAVIKVALLDMLRVAEAHEKRLGELDAVAGDGDHGRGMVRGLQAAADAGGSAHGGAGSVLGAAGREFGDRGGGTSGMLWGLLLEVVGRALGDQVPVTARALASALRGGLDALQDAGGASVGDKTMVDALAPFVRTFEDLIDQDHDLVSAWSEAADVAASAAKETASLRPRLGRARPLADRSVGTPDPGAVSMALMLACIPPHLARCDPGRKEAGA